jgi:hypothetical protein
MRVCKIRRCATTRSSLLEMNKTYPTEKQEKTILQLKKKKKTSLSVQLQDKFSRMFVIHSFHKLVKKNGSPSLG